MEERYTYLFDMDCQQLDHIFASGGVETLGYEHTADTVSDHDPSVAEVTFVRSEGAPNLSLHTKILVFQQSL
jgi:hypothetical protein